MHAIRTNAVRPGDVVVVRNVGPVGAPGMPEMVHLTVQLQGRGLGKDVALITDGRFSGVSHGILVGHISPEAAKGGPIGIVRDGDTIVIDPGARTLDLAMDAAEIARRLATRDAPADRAALAADPCSTSTHAWCRRRTMAACCEPRGTRRPPLCGRVRAPREPGRYHSATIRAGTHKVTGSYALDAAGASMTRLASGSCCLGTDDKPEVPRPASLNRGGCSCCGGRRCRGRTWP